MAELKCFSIAGVKLWFWSNDHEPPHFHAKVSGDWEVAVYFLELEEHMLEVKWRKRAMSAQHRKALLRMAAAHRMELLQEGEEIHP